jgi:DNA-binding CsgD family transcriptional regulator
MDRLRRHPRGRPPHPDVFTPAEWRVLAQLRQQRSNAEIAAELGLPINTVRTHVSSMLAKTGLSRRDQLAAWQGEPAPASRRTLSLIATRWLPIGAAAALAAVAVVLAILATRGGDSPPAPPGPSATQATAASPTSEATPTPTEPAAATAAPSPVPTATPGPPHLETFAPGDTIDVAPAALFIDPATGASEAWVIPGAQPEISIAPDGSYVIYRTVDGYRLLRTDDGSDRTIEADSLPVELGPAGAGFVASTQDRFVVSVFNGAGDHIGELWLGGPEYPSSVSWSPDASLIAYAIYPGGGSSLQLTLRTPDDSSTRSVNAGTASGGISLEWSHDSRRLAVVTDDWVRVFDRTGAWIGASEGEFSGFSANPRWSEDDAYLFVDWMPQVGGGEVAYLFAPDATPLFRFVVPDYAGGCGGEQWLDAQTIAFGQYDLRTDGTFETHDAPRDFWSAERLGVTLADGIAFHFPHFGTRYGYGELEDGRLAVELFTFGGGHGGCGEAWSGFRETEPHLDFPPYSDLAP